jgi:hypothetical protein
MGQLRTFALVALAITLVGCGSEKARRLKWNVKTTVDAYSEVGQRDPKWNDQALKTLKLFAQWRSSSAMQTEGIREQIAASAKDSIAAGCKDPLLLYVYARFVANKNESDVKALAYAHKLAADGMKASDYDSLRVFYATMRAGEALYRVKPPTKLDVAEMMNDSAINLNRAMSDGDIPSGELLDAARAYLSVLQTMRDIPRYEPWSRLDKELREKWGKEYRKTFGSSEVAID